MAIRPATIRAGSGSSVATSPVPQRRRVFDDVVTVELRALAGATIRSSTAPTRPTGSGAGHRRARRDEHLVPPQFPSSDAVRGYQADRSVWWHYHGEWVTSAAAQGPSLPEGSLHDHGHSATAHGGGHHGASADPGMRHPGDRRWLATERSGCTVRRATATSRSRSVASESARSRPYRCARAENSSESLLMAVFGTSAGEYRVWVGVATAGPIVSVPDGGVAEVRLSYEEDVRLTGDVPEIRDPPVSDGRPLVPLDWCVRSALGRARALIHPVYACR